MNEGRVLTIGIELEPGDTIGGTMRAVLRASEGCTIALKTYQDVSQDVSKMVDQ